MLIITRKEHEGFWIVCPDGTEIKIQVGRLTGDRARIAIQAPRDYRVLRDEIRDEHQEEKKDR